MEIEEMKDKRKLVNIKNEVDELSKKIIERMNEFGAGDVMSYRHDKLIMELINRICELQRKALFVCEYYDKDAEPVCRLFRDEPQIIRRLELSEEKLCPFR